MKGRIFLITCVLAGLPLAGIASDSGVAVKSCEVMDAPFRDARAIAALEKGDTVEIVKRKGGWLQVSAKGKTGWVRMLFVRRGASGEKASAVKEASGVLGLATGRAGSGNMVAATGVRGLDEEELKEAEFNEKQFETLKTYRVTKNDAQVFAGQAGLKAQTVPFIRPGDGN